MNKIKCPHCNHEYTSDDMHKAANDLWAVCPNGEDVEEFCTNCGEPFYIRGEYLPSYRMFKTIEELEMA